MNDFDLSFIITFAILCIIFILLIVNIMKCYKKCPSDKIMVIYGRVEGQKSSRCMHGGAAFVWPIFQSYMFLDLTPFSLSIDLRNALSRENIRINVPSSFTVAISTEPAIMQIAAERLLGKELRYIMNLAQDIIIGQMRLIIATMDVEEINAQRGDFLKLIQKNVESELKKIGLSLINVSITDIRDESGYIEALGREAEAKAINEAKLKVAELNRDAALAEKRIRMEQEKALEELENNYHLAKNDIHNTPNIAESKPDVVSSSNSDGSYQLVNLNENTISIQKNSKQILKIEFAHTIDGKDDGLSDSAAFPVSAELLNKSVLIVQRQSKNIAKLEFNEDKETLV